MNILIIGSGAREYSMGFFLKQDTRVKQIYFAHGNGGTENIGKNINISDTQELINFSKKNNINLTIVGPEQPLIEGIVDKFKENALNIFGPTQQASILEGSKDFAKQFAIKHNIPTPSYKSFEVYKEALSFLDTMDLPIVIKADGLCAGKGVIIAHTKNQAKEAIKDMLVDNKFKKAGKRIIIEEFLKGYELSVFAISDGEDYKILPIAKDYKRLLDGDEGPNTGGMGAIAPVSISQDLLEQIECSIVRPTINGMKNENRIFEGVLFCGLMISEGKPYLLEYNVRFGDPECQTIMPLIKSSLLDILLGVVNKEIKNTDIQVLDLKNVCVVGASKNYPFSSSKETKINIHKNINDCYIAHAGTKNMNNSLYANGGRVLCVIAEAKSTQEARKIAYEQIKHISFEGMQYRKDIGKE